MAFVGDRTPRENTSIVFSNWDSVLATARLDPTVRADYAREITRFQEHCHQRQTVASASAAQNYLAGAFAARPRIGCAHATDPVARAGGHIAPMRRRVGRVLNFANPFACQTHPRRERRRGKKMWGKK